MQNQILILAISFFVIAVTAQQKSASPSGRGANPIQLPTSNRQLQTSSYTVVVGISDYQDPAIPDLRFADKDAEAFANYLRSNSGGKLDNDHLKVLINQQATMAQFGIALDWLWEVVKEGDQVIIYFSGHGDVEKKSLTQPGYLLGWDAPASVYLAGGAMALPMFQDVISTLSVQNKAKVIVITDACRAGKLAGSSVGGSQITGANLAKQSANEIKILSCQPNEYSIEGEQWGGGRGAFSFHLIDALYGLADANNDQFVTLQEVSRYLEDHVSSEVAPVSQVPMIIGNRNERMTHVDESLLASIRTGKTNQMMMLTSIESRGIEMQVLSGVDTSIKELYSLFKNSLRDKKFLEPKNACADIYYEKLIAEPKLERLQTTMLRNYAAALQDDAQQVMNKLLKTDISELTLTQKRLANKYKTYPLYLERAAQLLGSQHYMYSILQARKHLFEGYILSINNFSPDKELGVKALAQFRDALHWQADLPFAYAQMSAVFGFNLNQLDSVEYYAKRASDLVPAWILPNTYMAYLFAGKLQQCDRAKPYLEKSIQIDSNSAHVRNEWGLYYSCKKQFEKAEQEYKKAIQLDSTYSGPYYNLEYYYLNNKRYDEAETQFKKIIKLDSTDHYGYLNLGDIYRMSQRNEEAEKQYLEAIRLDSTDAFAYFKLGRFYVTIKRNNEAELNFKIAISLDSSNSNIRGDLGSFYFSMGRFTEAEQAIKTAITLDSLNAGMRSNLGFLYVRTDRNAEAVDPCKKAISLDSSYAGGWNNLGLAYLNMKMYNEAEPVLKKAMLLNASFANTHRHLAMVFFKTGRIEEARVEFQKSISLDPNYPLAKLGMAYLLAKEGKNMEALDFIDQAIQKKASFDQLQKDEDLKSLIVLHQWKELMKKYFPEKMK